MKAIPQPDPGEASGSVTDASLPTQPDKAVPTEPGRASFSAAFQPRYFWMTLTTLAGVAIAALDNYIVNTAMPRVLVDLGNPALYAWVTSAFVLSQVVGLSVAGAWRDRSGLRAPFLVSVAIFGLGSLSCAFAPSMLLLVIARAFQGLGGGGMSAVAFAAAASYPEALRLRMFSLVSTVWGMISLVGPLLGGIITDTVGWRWIFLVNVPICALVVVLAAYGYPAVPSDRERALPVLRAGLLALAVGALVSAPSVGWYAAVPLVAAGLALGWWYLQRERQAAVPIIPVDAWIARGPVGSSLHSTMFFFASFVGAGVFLPLYLVQVRGESATQAGLVLTIGGISWTAGSIVGSQGRGRWPVRMVRGGALLVAISALFIAAQAAAADLPLVLLYLAWGVAGFGTGVGLIHPMNWAIVFSPPNQAGAVSSAVQTTRMVGGAAGGALMGAILLGVGAQPPYLRRSIAAIFLLVAILALWPATFGRPRGVDRSRLKNQAGIPKGVEAIA